MDSLLDLERLLEHPRTAVIADDASYFEFMCDVGMQWREAHNLPRIDRKKAGELYMTMMKTDQMEYQFP